MDILRALTKSEIQIAEALVEYQSFCASKGIDHTWVLQELTGYPHDAELPVYRKLRGDCYVTYVNCGAQIQDQLIDLRHLDTEIHDITSIIKIYDSIFSLEDKLKNTNGKYGFVHNPNTFKNILSLSTSRRCTDFSVISASTLTNVQNLSNVVDGIRGRLIDALSAINEQIILKPNKVFEAIPLLLEKFQTFLHAVNSTAKKNFSLEIVNEYDVQAIIYGLLKIHYDNVVPEDPTLKVGGGYSIVDFSINNGEILLEVKMTREGLNDKKLFDEIAIDWSRYIEKNPKESYVFIYDPSKLIKDREVLKLDISKISDTIRVFISG